MKLSQVPNLRIEDFPTEQDWIGKLFVQLNPFITTISQIFNQNVDYSTNIKSITQSFAITRFLPISMLWTFQQAPPVDVRIVSATRTLQNTPTLLLPVWSYNQSTSTVNISQIFEILAVGSTTTTAPIDGVYNFTIRAQV